MSRWIKKLHIYTGLLNFTILMVFGIAGLQAALLSKGFVSSVETREFRLPPNLDDLEAARAAYDFLNPKLFPPPAKDSVRRNSRGEVSFQVFSVNGPQTVTLLESQNRLRIETQTNKFWSFLNNLHATTVNANLAASLPVRMWSWYIEFAIWSLIFMSASGVYLWLTSRPKYRWAQICLAVGCAGFTLLYIVMR